MEPSPDYLLLGLDSPATCLQFFSHSNLQNALVAGLQNGSILIWDLKLRRVCFEKSRAHSNSVLNLYLIEIENEELKIISQGRDGFVKKWAVNINAGAWNEINVMKCQSLNFCRFSFNETYLLMFIPCENNASVLDVYQQFEKSQFQLKPMTEKKYGMLVDSVSELSPDQTITMIFGAYENGSIIIWFLNNKHLINKKEVDTQILCKTTEAHLHEEVIISIDYNATTNKGISGSADGTLCLWTLKNETELLDHAPSISLIKKLNLEGGIGCARIRQDGKIIAIGLWNSTIKIFGGKKLKHLATLNHHDESILCLCFNKNSKDLAVASKDKTISLWSLYNDK